LHKALCLRAAEEKVFMTAEEKHNTLKKIFWDYELQGEELYSILISSKDKEYLSQEKIILRMLERLGWHTILDLLGIEKTRLLLTKNIISKVHQRELRERYEFIRAVLSGEPVSFTGWGDEYYQKIKHTLFSYRWYRTQQALL
jgi:hypothetical protein